MAWLDLQRAATYTSLSVKTLRRFIGHVQHPLPCFYVNGKILCHSAELDEWVRGFPRGGNKVERLVEEILSDQKRTRSGQS